ncbi:MAG: DNA polymerase III subunit gamma/tau [Oscillospiraceae bacterium]|jgi:DNA polymerase-3 subunit gamma/tau|nr:DNA polymerase III subunit gamma/tau [Oscillospiraceae bacterium]
MYQVLYRKWRSQTFGDVIGQPHITATLRNALSGGRLSHAYLFTGPRGTGKTSCARILAKAVNCLAPQEGEPCNECALCKGIDAGAVLDVIEIDAASNNGVDNIRDLREETNFTPSQGTYRVYIIDEVHMLSAGAFNALLKTLEEPPSYVIFILATTEVHKLPATVLSRCQRFDFRRISAEDIAARLLAVAAKEGIALEEPAALLLARVADGAMRDALSLLDRCRAEGESVTAEAAARCIGLADRRYLFELTDAVLTRDVPACLELLAQLYRDACDMERLCGDLLLHLRNLLVLLTVKTPRELVLCTEEEFGRYQRQAKQSSAAQLLRFLELLENAAVNLRRSTDRRLEMELALIRLAADTQTPEAPANKVNTEHNKPGAAPLAAQGAFPAPPSAPAQQLPASAFAPPAQLKPFPQWETVLAQLRGCNPPLAGILSGSSAFRRDDFVLIQTENPSFPLFIRAKEHAASLKEVITAVTGETLRLGLFRREEAGQTPTDPLSRLAEKAGQMGIDG